MTSPFQKIPKLLPTIFRRFYSEVLTKNLGEPLEDRDQPDNRRLSAKYKSFPYDTITLKAPLVIDQVIKGLEDKREVAKILEIKVTDDLEEELEKCLQGLKELKEMINGKPIKPLVSSEGDVQHWNEEIEKLKAAEKDNLFMADAIFAESYIHRKIRDIFASKSILSSWDPYKSNKEALLKNNISFLDKISKRIVEKKMFESQPVSNKLFSDFSYLIKSSLWGNRFDLLQNIESIEEVKDLVTESDSELDKLIVLNHLDSAFVHILSDTSANQGRKIVDYVLGNAGVETVVDLMVADFLVTRCKVDEVRFHLKRMPWFVSAATRSDVFDAIRTSISVGEEKISNLADIAKRWPKLFTTGVWSMNSSPFWCLPKTFDTMQDEDLELYQTLTESHLTILKGDLNYRKMFGDKQWQPTTRILSATGGWGPCPVMAVRAIKSSVLVGFFPNDMLPEAKRWYANSKYGLIQFYRP